MKNLTAKKVMGYVALIGVLLLVLVYFLVFKSYSDKTDKIKEDNKVLNKRVRELKVYYDKQDSYRADIEGMQKEIRERLDEFPADVREEDMIVLAIDTERSAAVTYKNLNFGKRADLYTIPASKVAPAQMENLSTDLIFVKRTAEYVTQVDYTNLKRCIYTICDSENRLVIDDFVYKSNASEGYLDGTLTVTFFSLIGTGKEYVPQVLPAYENGLYNLFGLEELELDFEEQTE